MKNKKKGESQKFILKGAKFEGDCWKSIVNHVDLLLKISLKLEIMIPNSFYMYKDILSIKKFC